LRILLVPPNDWLCHPLWSRLHFIFERLSRNNKVHIINFRISGFRGKQLRSTKTHLHNATQIPAKDLSSYYVLNAPYHYELMRKIINGNNIDVVVTSNILASSIACIVSRRASKPIVYDYLDHFPDSASLYYKNLGVKAVVRNVVEFLVRKNFRYADKVVVPSRSLERMLKTEYNVNPRRLSLIPNGVDLDRFKPRNRIDALKRIKRLDLKDYLLLVFVGSVESRFDLETPILAVSKLAEEGVKVKMLVVGPELSNYNIYLKNKYSKLSCIEFAGYVDNDLVPFYIGAADICLAPYRVIKMNFSVTLKILEYLASEQIVFMTKIPDASEIFEKNVVVYSNSNDLREKILKVQRNKNEYLLRAKECSDVVSQYSWDKIASSYERLLENLVGS